MKCDIIKDLIPLSSEGLCSEESEKEITEHIKTCENCRLLYEKSPDTTADTPIPSEGETFKKVNRTFRRLTVKSGIIAFLLIAVLACIGYLTYGQITKETRSFETISQSFEVRKIAKYIAEGDFDSYVDSISEIYSTDVLYDDSASKTSKMDKQLLSETFEKAYGDTKVKSIHVDSFYSKGLFYNIDAYYIENNATIEFENGKSIYLSFLKNADGKYYSLNGYMYSCDTEEEMAFTNALVYANWHTFGSYRITEKMIKKTNDLTDEKSKSMYENRFRSEYREQVGSGRKAFHEAGFIISDAYFSDERYDKEKDMLYNDLCIEAEDSKGTAIMTARIYYDYMGMYPPEKDSIKIYSNNCTPELEEALYNFFG